MSEISFELERFEWASPDRLEVEGKWHGVRRRLPRATLVVEVDGERRRLRALPDTEAGSSERWVAAFPWKGEMPQLPGAELEVGRGIVVDLPRPRRSKARGAVAPAAPIPASTRAEREGVPGREEAERLFAVLTAARTEADEAASRATAAEAESASLRERAEAAEAELAAADVPALRVELEALRARAEAAEAQLSAAELPALQARVEETETELTALRARAEAAETEVTALSARAEAAETELTALRARAEEAEGEPAVAPDLARLRAELETADRDRIELRAQLDSTVDRLTAAEQRVEEQAARLRRRSAHREAAAAAASTSERTSSMPGPRTAAAGAPGSETAGDTEAGDDAGARRRFDLPAEGGEPRRRTARRPAERTARRPSETTERPSPSPSGPPLGERISDWVTSVTSALSQREQPQNGRGDGDRRTRASAGEVERAPTEARSVERSRAPRSDEARAQAAGAAARTRRRADRRLPADHGRRSWAVRVAAIGLLALLMIALIVILASLL